MLRRILLVVGLLAVVGGAGVYLAPGLLPGGPAGPEVVSERSGPTAGAVDRASGASVPTAQQVAAELAAWHSRSQTPDGAEGATSNLPPLLVERARARGLEARTPSTELLGALAELSYDGYRDIRFRPEEAIWRGQGPFQLQLFHPGSIQTDQVELYRISDTGAEPLAFDPALFDYAGPAAEVGEVLSRQLERERERGLGLDPSGFRIHHPLNTPGVWDELAVFLGASYFRLLGPGHVYGISGRGLAVNTTRIGSEEFPAFREFWMLDPAPDDDALRFWARLDGESVTGAYHFVLRPGSADSGRPTVLEVEAHLHVHQTVEELGLAPLTSMFLTAPTLGPALDDIRPRIHDSDGLLVHTAGDEWIWRPLSNGPGIRITGTDAPGLRGFGLAQRNRNFGDYLDLEARYHDRPSLWVEVLEGSTGWGPGSVRLLELPTPSEFDDNIVAFWSPDGGAEAGDEFRLRYRVVAFDNRLEQQTLAQVSDTRVGSAELPGATPTPLARSRRFVVDFSPAPLAGGSTEAAAADAPAPTLDGIEVVYRASTGRLFDVRAELLPDGRGWRATFALDPEREGGASGDPVASELALYLQQDGERLSETWAYRWIPAASATAASAAAATSEARP